MDEKANLLQRSKLQHDGIFCKVAHRNNVEYRAKKPTRILSNIAPRSKLQHGGSLLHLPSVPSDCCNHHLHQKFCKLLQICQTYKMWLGRDGSEFSTILHGVIPVSDTFLLAFRSWALSDSAQQICGLPVTKEDVLDKAFQLQEYQTDIQSTTQI